MNRVILGIKAIQQLGLPQIFHYALYQAGLRSGYLRWETDRERDRIVTRQSSILFQPTIQIPDRTRLKGILKENSVEKILEHANEICNGKVRLFGVDPQPLRLKLEGQLKHWTEYESGGQLFMAVGTDPDQISTKVLVDIKTIWEPGRFGWAYTLGRAYLISGDEKYAKTFWQYFEIFLKHNPPNYGPHWTSAQEVALRLIALVFCAQVFADAPQSTAKRMQQLASAIALHAARIPATLPYAKAQRNNHLLSEAAGLFTAGVALREFQSSAGWRKLGWHTFNQAVRDQISPDGVYIQQSANYQRLMLQLALWVQLVARTNGQTMPEPTLERLGAATRWLYTLVDPGNGHCPNLGPNDGAYFLPWTVCPFDDFRPVLQAAGQVTLGESLFPPGEWDEMALWFKPAETDLVKIRSNKKPAISLDSTSRTPHVVYSADGRSWAYLRAARFSARPGHADQLHLDLWWQGINIARDPGTYLYNASPPWDNALRHTAVHNTICVNSKDQMTEGGKFLYLDWAQAKIIAAERDPDGRLHGVTAEHNGYRAQGIIHSRSVTVETEHTWLVEDHLLHAKPSTLTEREFMVSLQWLLPDYPWSIDGACIQIVSPYGTINLHITPGTEILPLEVQLTRAGELLYGNGPAQPNWGWYSPTYASKLPALSLRVSARVQLPWTITSRWVFPENVLQPNTSTDKG